MRNKEYGVGSMIKDLFLIWATGGIWIIIMVVREIREIRRK